MISLVIPLFAGTHRESIGANSHTDGVPDAIWRDVCTFSEPERVPYGSALACTKQVADRHTDSGTHNSTAIGIADRQPDMDPPDV